MRPITLLNLAAATALVVMTNTGFAAPAWIAGVHPDRRPAQAPVIKTVAKDSNWYRRALHGVEPPYPASLRFLEDQGNWYTPFIHPGMTPPYDLRGWHKR